MMSMVCHPVRNIMSRVAYTTALVVMIGVWSPVRAQVEANDPACRDPAFMADALEAIMLKSPNTPPGWLPEDKMEVMRRMVANGWADAKLENPEAASKGPDFLGCLDDVVVGTDRMRLVAKRTTEGSNVTWLVLHSGTN